ncbi:MAG TPA: hypothetical protein VG536_08045 [Pseudomonas sp.]|jgi:hypothetical protein|nr:hypothetical protein [Pseudomonas sp.]
MKTLPWTLLSLGLFNTFAHADCNCLSYPFEPAPPCYSQCAKSIVDNEGKDVDKIQNLPSKVRNDLQILIEKKQNAQAINFNSITSAYSLDKAATKMQQQDKWETNGPAVRQLDRQQLQQLQRAPAGGAQGM